MSVSGLVETLLAIRIFIFALRMAKGSRKRKAARLANLVAGNVKNSKHKSKKATNVNSITNKRARKEIPPKTAQKSLNNDQTKVTKDVKKLPFRDAVHTELYFEKPKPRGLNGGYKKILRSVRNLQSSREENKAINEKAKARSRDQTKQRQAARKLIDEAAHAKLLEVCYRFCFAYRLLHSVIHVFVSHAYRLLQC